MASIFDSEYADMQFSWQRVAANAEQIGRELGIAGPYFYPIASSGYDSKTHMLNGELYTVRDLDAIAIVGGRMSVRELADELFIDVHTAFFLHRRIRRRHQTAEVRHRAIVWENGRVAFARKLEPRRQELLAA